MEFPKYDSLPAPLRAFLRIMRHVWFVWAVCIFTLTAVFAMIAYLFIFNLARGKRKEIYTFYATKYWGKTLLFFFGIRYKVEGAECLDKERNYIFVSNHQSALDIPFCMASCPQPFSFLAKHEVDRIPVVGYLARNMHVYVNRKSEKSRKESADRMIRHMEAGRSIHIYPEGTRNRTDMPLKDFYNGAFRLAIETQRPIAVLCIGGSNKAMHPNFPFQLSPAYVPCIWSEPIETKGMSLDDVEHLKNLVRQRLIENMQELEIIRAY